MHPDYLDYVPDKQKVLYRAQWHDVKFLVRKIARCELAELHVEHIGYDNWRGWLVEFAVDVDVSEIKRLVYGTLVVGQRAVFIGVSSG